MYRNGSLASILGKVSMKLISGHELHYQNGQLHSESVVGGLERGSLVTVIWQAKPKAGNWRTSESSVEDACKLNLDLTLVCVCWIYWGGKWQRPLL